MSATDEKIVYLGVKIAELAVRLDGLETKEAIHHTIATDELDALAERVAETSLRVSRLRDAYTARLIEQDVRIGKLEQMMEPGEWVILHRPRIEYDIDVTEKEG